MAGWVPTSIGLQGMLHQLTAGSVYAPTPSTPGSLPPGWVGPAPGSGTPSDDGRPSSWDDFWASQLKGLQSGRIEWFPGAVTDFPQLFGTVGQAFQPAPDTQLANAIAQRMGITMGATRNLADAATQRQIRDIAQRAQTDSSLRQQLASWMGWNGDNPHVQFWIQSGGGLPANPTEKDLGTAPAETKTAATTTNGTVAAASAAKVPFPFAYSIFANPNYHGYNFGDQAPPHSYKSGWHEGQDYGVPNNTSIAAPFSGKVHVGYDPSGYGNYVDLVFGSQGNYLRFAHLGYVTVKEGQVISPGTQLGLSGSTGYSTGPHLLIEERNGHGQPLDPRPLLNAIYNNGTGNTFAALDLAGVTQTGTLATDPDVLGYELTPDGKRLYAGSPDRQLYDLLNTAYKQRYGVDAPYSMVMAMRAAGVQNASQMAAVAANWPSDIPGMTFGQRDIIYDAASQLAMKQWGRPIPDSLVKRLASQGITGPSEIQLWFDTHVPGDMPPAEYQQIYDAAAPAITETYGEPPAPDYVGYLWGQAQTAAVQGGSVATSARAVE